MIAALALWIGCASLATAAVPLTLPNNAPKPLTDNRAIAPSHVAAASTKPTQPPIALIGFLGEFADVADGLDPMSLAEHADTTAQPKTVEHKP